MQKPQTYHPSGKSAGQRVKEYDQRRLDDRAFYWSTPWREFRAAFLSVNPWCEWCLQSKPPRYTLATQVDHRKPRIERPDLAFDLDNCRAACASCHARYGSKRGRAETGPGRGGAIQRPRGRTAACPCADNAAKIEPPGVESCT